MSNFTYILSEKIVDFNEETIKVFNIHIKLTSGKLDDRSASLHVKLVNGSTIVASWLCQVSGNHKELDAWFTTDAFSGFSGTSKIVIAYDDFSVDYAEGVDMSNYIPASDASATDATNEWLQELIDTQSNE